MEIKVGDWGIIKPCQDPCHCFDVGDVVQAIEDGSYLFTARRSDGVTQTLRDDNWEPLHPLTDAEFSGLKEGDRLAIINFANIQEHSGNGTICKVLKLRAEKIDVTDIDVGGDYYVRKHEVALLPPVEEKPVEKSKPSVLPPSPFPPSPCRHPEWLGHYRDDLGGVVEVSWNGITYSINGIDHGDQRFKYPYGSWHSYAHPLDLNCWTKVPDWTPPEKRRVNVGWDPDGGFYG